MEDKENDIAHDAEDSVLKIPLPVNRLLLGFRIPFKVYMKKDRELVTLFNKWTLFDQDTKEILNEKGITTVYIEGTQSKIEDYLKDTSKIQTEEVDKTKFYEYSIKKDNYLNIDKTLLVDRNLFVKNTKVNFSIFLIADMLFEELVHATADHPAEIPDTVFKSRGDFAVRIMDIPLYKEYLNSVLASPDIPENLKQKSRALSIKENSKMLVRDVLSSPMVGEKMDEIGAAVCEMTDLVLKKEVSVYDLMSLKSHDLYTYTHSVNVAVMSIAICSALEFDRELVEKVGVGAIMHDIGKASLPPNLLNKQGKLTNDEFALMKTHVVEGVKILENKKEIPKEALVVVLQHHERLSGSGYPFGLRGEKMRAFGRIASMVDCYDYLTTPRPYRYAYTPYMALSLLAKETKERGDFDSDYLKMFIKIVAGCGVDPDGCAAQ
ncbi:MAG: HD domain-containing phosphohydrolase [Dissulfurispiraceae bacterium]|jgi:putative nucleotidyltransferase with HDIG domain